jgi:hypothetical protein
MSMKKVLCILASGLFMAVFSAKAVACPYDSPSSATTQQIIKIGGNASQIIGARAIASSDSKEQKYLAPKGTSAKRSKPAPPAKAAAAVALQADDDDWSYGGSCIHANGCTCYGPRSHRRTCGTNGDCHAHSGLVCTWGGMLTE